VKQEIRADTRVNKRNKRNKRSGDQEIRRARGQERARGQDDLEDRTTKRTGRT
jgi:hypothetical protein